VHCRSSPYTRTASAQRDVSCSSCIGSSVTPYAHIGPHTTIGRGGRWSRGVALPWATGASEARHASVHCLSSLYTRTASAKRDVSSSSCIGSSVTPYAHIGPHTAIGRGGRSSCRVALSWATGASEARHASVHCLSSLCTRTASAQRDVSRSSCIGSSVTPDAHIGPHTAIGRGGRSSCRVALSWATGASEARHASVLALARCTRVQRPPSATSRAGAV
jgi:hypothetical protein